jgi:hypothetical protein
MEIYVCGPEALYLLFLQSPPTDSPTTHAQIVHLAMKEVSIILETRAPLIYELCSLPNRNCSLPTEKTEMPLRELTHAGVNLYVS